MVNYFLFQVTISFNAHDFYWVKADAWAWVPESFISLRLFAPGFNLQNL
jgi:hypothetical protein